LTTHPLQRYRATHATQSDPEPSHQLPKKKEGEGQLFSVQTPKKDDILGSSRFTARTKPLPPSSIPCKNVFSFLIGFCILFFYRFLVTPEKKIQQTKHLVHFAFFFFFGTNSTLFSLTLFYYALFSKNNNTILTLSYLHINLYF
jgi:hypothetical protein